MLSHSLKVEPKDHFVNLQQDPYGNFLARFVFPQPVSELTAASPIADVASAIAGAALPRRGLCVLPWARLPDIEH